MVLRDGMAQVVRRVRVDTAGVVVYGTASTSLVDSPSGTALPVFDRLAVYQLVPACTRSFARRLDKLGLTTLDAVQGERGVVSDTGLVLRWRAFGTQKTIVARGRVHGPMAEILKTVTEHLPSGERFGLPGFADQPVLSVLRGVPEPLRDKAQSLRAHESLLAARADDRSWLLDAFALACALGAREAAEELLQRWSALASAPAAGAFPDASPGGLTAEVLRRLLPSR